MASEEGSQSSTSGDDFVCKQRDEIEEGRFSYTPLDPSADGMRLLILEPSFSRGDELHCRLAHTTFAQFPEYEALSYTWGNEEPKIDILLDGKPFSIRDNLRGALVQLRSPTKERVLWVDAICINQDDIPERNEQVRIMWHIYSRAQMVLAWLGSCEIECSDPLMRMVEADYWNRVWIVQEIGKARKIKIHYSYHEMDWETFIDEIKMPQTYWYNEDCVPLKLADQMLDKYGDGYKLENLLKTHQKALCKDVRDKIYGFAGLANDNYGRLVVDYQKSPFEVWNDVVRFRNADTTIHQYDIIQFAELARKLLGIHTAPYSKDNFIVDTDFEDEIEITRPDDPKNELLFCPARLWGRIAWVGPTYNELRGNLRKVDEWLASIRDHVADPYLRSAYEENDILLQLLEDMDPSHFEIASPIGPKTLYTSNNNQGLAVSRMDKVNSKNLARVEKKKKKKTKSIASTTTMDKHLILLDILPRDDETHLEASRKFSGIGLASRNATIGDFVCGFYEKKKAAIVRKKGFRSGIVASAIFLDLRAMAIEKKEANKITEVKFEVLANTPPNADETINLYMDIETLYNWTD